MYVNDFFKNEHSYSNFFSGYSENTSLSLAKRKLKAAVEKMNEVKEEYLKILSSRYNDRTSPIEVEYVLRYKSNRSPEYYYFDSNTGESISVNHDSDMLIKEISLPTKNGNYAMITGYCYELASVIVREYHYNISTKNDKANLVYRGEYLIPLVEFNGTAYHCDIGGNITEVVPFGANSILEEALGRQSANEFIHTFYGIADDRDFTFSLHYFLTRYQKNKSFEVILRTVKEPRAMRILLEKESEKSVPPYKLINSNKAVWKYAKEHDVLSDFIEFKDFLSQGEVGKLCKEKLHKTDNEWIDFLEKSRHWADDLAFYGMRTGMLSRNLVSSFIGASYSYRRYNFNKYYSFNKYCSYVIEETINQGYSSYERFIETLGDYLSMCEDLEVTPTLFSSYLSQTHDIVSRNHKINLSPSQEEAFKSQYKDFKKMVFDNEYAIIAPTCSFELRKEGDELNHCVASYIKRVIDGNCKILFLRKVDAISKSLVTLELRHNAIVQARGLHNRDITKEEHSIVARFCAERKYEMHV